MLHIVTKSPRQSRTLQSCLRLAQAGQSLLLIEDAIYAATAGGATAGGMAEATQRLKVYALRADVQARGMAGKVIAGVTEIDYGGFVDLVAEHSTHQTWL